MDPTMGIVIGVVVLLAVTAGVWIWTKQRQSAGLRQQFGPEYNRAVATHGDARSAEAELKARQERVQHLNIRPLSSAEYQQYVTAWRTTQAQFVDEPAKAITKADQLVSELMRVRGYPVGDFEQRAADISVDHPNVVTNYRAARAIALTNHGGKARTEELRQALVHYRALFEDLLETEEKEVAG